MLVQVGVLCKLFPERCAPVVTTPVEEAPVDPPSDHPVPTCQVLGFLQVPYTVAARLLIAPTSHTPKDNSCRNDEKLYGIHQKATASLVHYSSHRLGKFESLLSNEVAPSLLRREGYAYFQWSLLKKPLAMEWQGKRKSRLHKCRPRRRQQEPLALVEPLSQTCQDQ
jgi:hypothetical protein